MRRFDGIGCLVTTAVIAATVSCDDVSRPVMTGQYATPDATLHTLVKAIEASSQPFAMGSYMGCFADSAVAGASAYHHDFDPSDVASLSAECGCAPSTHWDIAREFRFYRAFVAHRPDVVYDAVFDPLYVPDPPPTSREALLRRRYQLWARIPGRGLTLLAIGHAYLILVRTPDGRWQIARWEDHVDPEVGVRPGYATLGWRRLESTR